MKRCLPLHACLAFALLFGQLATLWHAVGHFGLAESHKHAVHASHLVDSPFHVAHDEPHAHVHGADIFQQTAKATIQTPDGDTENCLLFHALSGQYAPAPSAPALPGICVSDIPRNNWQTTASLPETGQPYFIRGPPTDPVLSS